MRWRLSSKGGKRENLQCRVCMCARATAKQVAATLTLTLALTQPTPPGGGTRPLGFFFFFSPCDESSVPIFLRYILLALFQRPLMKERFVTSDMAAEGGGATRTHVGSSAGRWAGW